MNEIVIPKELAPLIKAFSADDEVAKILIAEAAKAISGAEPKSYDLSERKATKEELNGILALMKGINPQDTIEMIYGAQIVTSHMSGLRFLRHGNRSDQVLGLKLLRFSNEAMIQLQKKRSGGVNQNINISYSHNGSGPAFMQTVIKEESCQ